MTNDDYVCSTFATLKINCSLVLAKFIWNQFLLFSLLFFVATYDFCALVGQCHWLSNEGKTLGSEMPQVRYVDVSNILSV